MYARASKGKSHSRWWLKWVGGGAGGVKVGGWVGGWVSEIE